MQIPGIRFRPTPKEILIDYLFERVMDRELPSNAIIDCDLYSDQEEWKNIFQETGETSLYFFTNLRKKIKKTKDRGSRIERVTGMGTWKATQKDTKIYALYQGKKLHIGSKKGFKFLAKQGSDMGTRGKWLMDEFRLDGSLLKSLSCLNKDNDLVVCHVKHEQELRAKTRNFKQQDENANMWSTLKELENMLIDSSTEAASSPHQGQMGISSYEGLSSLNSVSNSNMWNTVEELENILNDSSTVAASSPHQGQMGINSHEGLSSSNSVSTLPFQATGNACT